MARCEGCKRVQVNLNSVDSDCIALTGNGTTIPFQATPILDPDGTLECGPAGLRATCQSELLVTGGVPPGSIPPQTVDFFGAGPDWPNYCAPGFMAPWGPQADVLITNTTLCSLNVEFSLNPAGAIIVAEPGVRWSIGWALDSAGVNLPPGPITFGSAFFSGGINTVNNAAVGICTASPDQPSVGAAFFPLAPGDFIWVSLQALLFLTGTAGSTTITPIFGAGPSLIARGVRT